MNHQKHNQCVAFFFNDISEREQHQFQNHLEECDDCQAYVHTLKKTDVALKDWLDEAPRKDTFDRIMAAIPARTIRLPEKRKEAVWMPFMQITLAVMLLASLIYIVHTRLSVSTIWSTLTQISFFKSLGSLGSVALLFFALGSFITLAIYPVLYLESRKDRSIHHV